MDERCRDETLMAEAAQGRRAALEALMRRHATPLLTFIERMTGDHHRGEELFQEVFLAVWRKRHLYQYPRPFKTWLYAIAVNRCREAFRREAMPTLPLADQDLLAAAPGSPVETAIAAETATLVAAALALLPPQQRTVVVLRVWQQMSYAEIARALETAEGTVRGYMHHGLCSLRKHLEPRLAPGG
jgi:RNA polymerase sigma-70 factor (ECF subfamily)